MVSTYSPAISNKDNRILLIPKARNHLIKMVGTGRARLPNPIQIFAIPTGPSGNLIYYVRRYETVF
jgi:hypothetical protein